MKRIIAILLAIILACCAAACARGSGQAQPATPASESRAAGESAELVLTKANFDEAIAGSTPILVDFWASWCGPCMKLAPIVEELASSADGSYRVGKVNVDEQPELAARYGITAIPQLFVFKNGEIAGSITGLTDREAIIKLIENAK